ncbi:MAG: hypothetical protein WC838_02180, partial [Candidatus Margulisiibacteriota bacterium]
MNKKAQDTSVDQVVLKDLKEKLRSAQAEKEALLIKKQELLVTNGKYLQQTIDLTAEKDTKDDKISSLQKALNENQSKVKSLESQNAELAKKTPDPKALKDIKDKLQQSLQDKDALFQKKQELLAETEKLKQQNADLAAEKDNKAEETAKVQAKLQEAQVKLKSLEAKNAELLKKPVQVVASVADQNQAKALKDKLQATMQEKESLYQKKQELLAEIDRLETRNTEMAKQLQAGVADQTAVKELKDKLKAAYQEKDALYQKKQELAVQVEKNNTENIKLKAVNYALADQITQVRDSNKNNITRMNILENRNAELIKQNQSLAANDANNLIQLKELKDKIK